MDEDRKCYRDSIQMLIFHNFSSKSYLADLNEIDSWLFPDLRRWFKWKLSPDNYRCYLSAFSFGKENFNPQPASVKSSASLIADTKS